VYFSPIAQAASKRPAIKIKTHCIFVPQPVYVNLLVTGKLSVTAKKALEIC
jgi:hypothetical protein